MVEQASTIEVYQLHMRLCEISPLIWRRLTVRSDSTITDLHYTVWSK
jgi:Plasmid pRiA4b ORF-3-like protein